MAENKLGEFYNEVPGSNFSLKDIDSNLDGRGDLRELHDIDVIINSISKILNIQKGTYLFDPEFGVGLHKYLFEPADQKTYDNISREVKNAVYNYEKRAKILVDIKFFSNKRGFVINIGIEMDGERRATSIKIDENLVRSV